MISWAFNLLVGNKNKREIKKFSAIVRKIKAFEIEFQKKEEGFFKEKTREWKEKLSYYLPMEIPPTYVLENKEFLKESQRDLEKKFQVLREEFPQIPSEIETSIEGIQDAIKYFNEFEPEFQKKRKEFLSLILPEAYALVRTAASKLVKLEFPLSDQNFCWDMVHFDVQLIGGIALHNNSIAEMQTGEGKTLVSTLPCYLNSLTGLGVHIVTVNDYLAKRDSEWMSPLYSFLGVSVGCLQNQQALEEKKMQYSCDLTYGTSSEFGFDYLRDNGMSSSKEEQVQRGHYFALVDEIDSILIDEARTPLIISGPSFQKTNQEYENYSNDIKKLVQTQKKLCNDILKEIKNSEDEELLGNLLLKLKLAQPKHPEFLQLMEVPEKRRLLEKEELSMHVDTRKKEFYLLKEELYFTLEERTQEADLTEKGRNALSPSDKNAFILPDIISQFSQIDSDETLNASEKIEEKEQLQNHLDSRAEKIHATSQLLRANCLYEKDIDYLVKEGKVIIIDENTGREMPGRRWSDGLHQAIEAKEAVQIDEETQTFASITIQNYFRLYEKLSGMTGTAETEAAEFFDIYKLKVLMIPTNKPSSRIDRNDYIFKTERERNHNVVKHIGELHAKGQPILVGTNSVNASERISQILKKLNIPHSILNAKNHSREAEIIARAGQRGAVTISTNMAGRGTDIKLGEGVKELGGLSVIGTERYESRRIDRQLQGRCARQGDPGISQFYVSFEDNLMRNFASTERITKIMEQLGLKEGEALEHKWLNRSIQMAQKRVEQRNYLWRKRILEFDDILNQQRTIIYTYRKDVLHTENIHGLIQEIIVEGINLKTKETLFQEKINIEELLHWIRNTLPKEIHEKELINKNPEEVAKFVIKEFKEVYQIKISHENSKSLDKLERQIILSAIDQLWQFHLHEMDSLREGIQLRAQGQKDPLIEYKRESFTLFSHLVADIQKAVLENLFRSTSNLQGFEKFLSEISSKIELQHIPTDAPEGEITQQKKDFSFAEIPNSPSVGRNASCPCGSGMKYKKCCGK